MDRQNFLCDTLAKVHSEGFGGDTDSVIALLVFALGELAQQGLEGDSIDTYNGRPSGLRGGNLEKPPGLALFNEARKRMGFILTDCDLENVQIFSLAAYVISLLDPILERYANHEKSIPQFMFPAHGKLTFLMLESRPDPRGCRISGDSPFRLQKLVKF